MKIDTQEVFQTSKFSSLIKYKINLNKKLPPLAGNFYNIVLFNTFTNFCSKSGLANCLSKQIMLSLYLL